METKRMQGSCSAIDRISNLPCNVIDDILTYMPLRDAVRTSILSRGWRYKWRTIPHLVFNRDFKENLHKKHTAESVIYQVLLLHRGSITKFTCLFGNDCWPAVDQWLNFLSDHRIEELKLRIFQPVSQYLFTFDHLKHLSLIGCNLKPPTAFKGFGTLAILVLNGVTIESAELSSFIFKCPILERFELYNTTLPALEINAPNLKSFCFFTILEVVPSICLKNASFLQEVTIHLRTVISQGSRSNFYELLSQLSSIEKLVLQLSTLQKLATDGVVPHKLPNNLSRLIVLECDLNFANAAEVSWFVCLMRSSPDLQKLEISSLTWEDQDMDPSALFLKEQRKVKLTPSRLKDVKINDFSGLKAEMEFVKLLLSAATGLKRLELELYHPFEDATDEVNRMLKRLARFRRASSEAKVII